MPFITQGKTNWKFLLIVIVLTVIVGGGALWFAEQQKAETVYPLQLPELKEQEKTAEDETADWQTYRNEEYGFEFKYPSEFEIIPSEQFESLYSFLKERLVFIQLAKSFPDYNLSISYVLAVTKSKEDNQPAKCFLSPRDKTPLTETVNINEVIFYHGTDGGAAAGTQYSSEIYRTIYREECLEVTLIVKVSSDWNIEGVGLLSEKEKEKGFDILDQILSTFRFIEENRF